MKKIVITSVACLVLWANVASAQPQVSGPFLPSGCTADQTIAYNATTAAWECDSTISVTSLTASGTAPVVTWTDTTAGEDDFSFTVDADVGTLASGATNIFQAFGATHASAGQVAFSGSITHATTGSAFTASTAALQARANSLVTQVPFLAFGYEDGSQTYMPAAVGYRATSFTGNTKGDLVLATRDVTTDTEPTDRVRITSAGYFGVNGSVATVRYQNTTIGVLSSLLSDDGTNYGGLTITPNAADVTFAAVTAGTFGDNVDLMFTPAGTGDMWLTLGDLNIDTDAGVLNFGASQDNAIGRADASSLYVSKGLHVGDVGAVADNALTVEGNITGGNDIYAAAGGEFRWTTRARMQSQSDGTIRLINAAATGFTTLEMGPTTGNTASGSTSFTHVSATIDMATATGTGTGTITVANFFPAGCVIDGFSGRVTTILAGAALTTWSIGPTGDLDMFGTTLALAQDTLVRPQTYTITSTGQVFSAATDLVLTAAAGVFSTGVLTVTATCKTFTPIGS